MQCIFKIPRFHIKQGDKVVLDYGRTGELVSQSQRNRNVRLDQGDKPIITSPAYSVVSAKAVKKIVDYLRSCSRSSGQRKLMLIHSENYMHLIRPMTIVGDLHVRGDCNIRGNYSDFTEMAVLCLQNPKITHLEVH